MREEEARDRTYLMIERKSTLKIGNDFHSIGTAHGITRSVPEGKTLDEVREEMVGEIVEFLKVVEEIAKEELRSP